MIQEMYTIGELLKQTGLTNLTILLGYILLVLVKAKIKLKTSVLSMRSKILKHW